MESATSDEGQPFGTQGRELLERIATGAPLGAVLTGIVELVERQAPGMICTVLLLDAESGTLHHGASPSLPDEYSRAIDGSAIGPRAGSCGAAAFRKTRVIVEDIATHPYWEDYRSLALPHGLRACWSTPIMSPEGDVLGTFAMYFHETRGPRPVELGWVDAATHLAAIAITRDRTERSWADAESRARQIARLYAVSSSVADAIVRERDPMRLYQVACRIAVEHGLARLAWVGLYDAGADRFQAVARDGNDDGYIDAITLSLGEPEKNRGPAARALVSGLCAVSHDIARDPEFFWKEAALSRGLRSCAAFPLKVAGRTIGVLVIYVDRPGYFTAEAQRVLTALANNISFAVESARIEDERQRLLFALGERVKELTLLHSVARLLQSARPFDQSLMRELVNAVPNAFQFPAICEARLIWNGLTASTPAWRDNRRKLVATIEAASGAGLLEVVYTRDEVAGTAAEFLTEERQLLQSIADMISTHLGREVAIVALRHSEERLRAVIEHTPNVGIQWYDAHGRVLFSNQASEAMFGWTGGRAIGRKLDELNFPAADAERLVRAIAEVAETSKPVGPIELSYRRPSGDDGTLLSTIFRIPTAGGDPCYVCTAVDLTERKRAEEQRRLLETELQQAQRTQALGTLAGGIAHDFNNILTAIAGNAGLALSDVPAAGAAAECLEEIRGASERASKLVRQILAFGRPGPSTRELVDLHRVVDEAVGLLRATLPPGVSIRCVSAPDTPAVLADSSQLHQIVMNLGTNAIHALGTEGGTMDVTTDRRDLTEATLGLPPGTYVRLQVADSGCGMDAETMSRVFDPFFTTKHASQGTGLGLSVVHGIVTSHKGAITVHSQLGRGSVFELLFPAAPTTASVTVARSAHPPGAHILYVDDERALANLSRRMLERLGFRVTAHTSPIEALEEFRSRPLEFDAVVTDIAMDGMSGIDLAREMLAIRPDVPIVLTSGYLQPEALDAARALGIKDVVLKPNTVHELGALLSRILGGRGAKPGEDRNGPAPVVGT